MCSYFPRIPVIFRRSFPEGITDIAMWKRRLENTPRFCTEYAYCPHLPVTVCRSFREGKTAILMWKMWLEPLPPRLHRVPVSSRLHVLSDPHGEHPNSPPHRHSHTPRRAELLFVHINPRKKVLYIHCQPGQHTSEEYPPAPSSLGGPKKARQPKVIPKYRDARFFDTPG